MTSEQPPPPITLYYSPKACSLASHIVLEASGLPYTAVAVNIRAQENRQPAYLRINPSGAVPALGVGDQVLTESQAILTWVAGCEGEVWCYEPIPPYACGCTVGAMRLS